MDTVKAIKINNTGAFVGHFYAVCGLGRCSNLQQNVSVGTNVTLSGFGMATQQWGPDGPAGPVEPNINPGDEMWPVVDVSAGKTGHEASENVIWDPASTVVGVYNCGGTTAFPSFDYQGTEPG